MGKFKQFLREKENAYQKFFKKKLDKWGVESPEDLSDEDKKKFFNEIDSEWDSKNEVEYKDKKAEDKDKDKDDDEVEDDEDDELNESSKIQRDLEKYAITIQKVTQSFGRGGFMYRNLPTELQADSLKIMVNLSAVNGMIEDMIYEIGTGSY